MTKLRKVKYLASLSGPYLFASFWGRGHGLRRHYPVSFNFSHLFLLLVSLRKLGGR